MHYACYYRNLEMLNSIIRTSGGHYAWIVVAKNKKRQTPLDVLKASIGACVIAHLIQLNAFHVWLFVTMV